MFIPGNGGLGAPGQRESKVENFESRVKIPLAQYAIISITCTILAGCDAIILFLLVFWLGARGTWLACGVVAVPLVFVAVRRFAALRRYQYPIAVAVIAASGWWYVYGYNELFLYNWPAMFDVPPVLIVGLVMLVVPFHAFARYFIWGMRSDMTDANFPPTRRAIDGNVGPLGPDTKFRQLMPEPPTPNTTMLVRQWAVEEQSIELQDGTRVTLHDALNFLKASEVANRGLTLQVAVSCGKDRDWWKAFVHHLQAMGLAAPNGQGKPARLVKPAHLVLTDLGFNLSGDDTVAALFDDDEQDDGGGDMT